MPIDLSKEKLLSNSSFFKARYDANLEAGVAKLMEGNVTTFAGATEAMKGELIVAIRPQSGVGTMYLLDELRALEKESGFTFFLAGRQFPLHVTVQVATGGFEAEAVLAEDRYLVTGLSFNRLVLDGGGTIMLMNEGVPRELAEWRGWASQVMTEYGGQPKPLPILHSTLARIMSPKAPSIEDSGQLVKWVQDWNKRLQETPVNFAPGYTYVGTIYDLLTL